MSHYIPNLLLCSALLFSVGFPISTGADEKPEDLTSAVRLKNSTIVEGSKERGISALMLDVFLPGWRECVDWKRGGPSTQCVPFPVERPENCTKEIWSKAMADVDQGKLKNCA